MDNNAEVKYVEEDRTKHDKKVTKTTRKSKKKRQCFPLTIERARPRGRRVILRTVLICALILIILILVESIYVLDQFSPSIYTLTRQLNRILFNEDQKRYVFRDITTAGAFWSFLNDSFAEIITRDFYYNNVDDMKIPLDEHEKHLLMTNAILGVPRLRQVRVRNGSCSIHHHLLKHFATCYGDFNMMNRGTEPFGLETGTAWTYSSAEETKSLPYWGAAASYEGGGYYVDLPLDPDSLYAVISELQENIWVTPATRAIFLDMTLYNGNLNLFVVVRAVLEMPPSGFIITSVKINCNYFYISFLHDLFALLAYLGIIIQLAIQLTDVCFLKFRYLTMFWKHIEMMIIFFGLTCMGIAIYMRTILPGILKEITSNPDKYANMEHISQLKCLQINFLALVLFAVYIKIFKLLGVTRFMQQINLTLSACVAPVTGFSVMFFLVFIAYAQLGYLVFGTKVLRYSSFGVSMFSLLRILLGDSDYFEMERAYETIAALFFLTYIVIVFFILFNMFQAIIDDEYGAIKTGKKVSLQQEQKLVEYIKELLFRLFMKRGKYIKCLDPHKNEEKTVLLSDIRKDLRKCGFSHSYINYYFNEMNIDGSTKNIDLATLHKEKEKKAFEDRLHINDLRQQQIILYSIEDQIAILDRKLLELVKKFSAYQQSH